MSLAATLVLSFLLTVLGHGKTAGNVQTQTVVTADVTGAPTDTPSVTPTDTPTVTPTDTPSVTPTLEPSVTPLVSPTPTATVTPTPVQEGDGDKDDMLGLKANFHALFGLMNAAFHHETNEARFEQKHGVNSGDK